MTQTAENRSRSKLDPTFLVVCAVLQVVAFGAAVFVAASPRTQLDPWPTVVTFGIVLAQCSLAAAFAVLGPWKLPTRMICTAAIVVLGVLVIVMADEPRVRRAEAAVIICLFALLMWGINQLPFWACRLYFLARAVVGDHAENFAGRSQYGIRQLMGLTLAVSLVLGLGRMLAPAETVEELRSMRATDWIVFVLIATAASLMVSTTIVTTLNPRYWRAGIIVSAISSGLIAYGVYSAFAVLSSGGPPSEPLLFGVMLLCTYAWLQISVLLVRASGYRIVIGA